MKDRFVMMTYTRVLVNLDYYIDTPQETLNGGTLHILQGEISQCWRTVFKDSGFLHTQAKPCPNHLPNSNNFSVATC